MVVTITFVWFNLLAVEAATSAVTKKMAERMTDVGLLKK